MDKIEAAGLSVHVRRAPNDKVDIGRVYAQQPAPGERIDKGNTVTILVSSGKPKVTVPGVVGQQATDAVAALTARGLKADIHNINSDKETGSVTGQFPKAGTRVFKGEKVRINVSQGPKPIAVPPVVGSPYETAAGTLQGAGFAVARRDVESNEPKGTVIQQDPGANTTQSVGATITLFVSKGPKVAAVPDVTSFSRADAIATLRNSGFKVSRGHRRHDRPDTGRRRPHPDARPRRVGPARSDGDDHGRALHAAAADGRHDDDPHDAHRHVPDDPGDDFGA